MSSDFDFMEVEFNFGPNYQKGKLTQSSEIKPYCCHLPITMLHNSAAKNDPFLFSYHRKIPIWISSADGTHSK